MGQMLKKIGVPVLVLAVGLVAGYAFGQRQGLATGMEFLESEVSGSLARHVEAAACVRVGDADCALQVLDRMIDSAVLSLDNRPDPSRASRPMGDAKTYRAIVPASGPRAEDVRAVLNAVAFPEVAPAPGGAPATALARLAARSGG